MLNSVVFMGRLTADPELRTTPNGVSVTSFTNAVDRPFQRAGSERVADFFDVVAWRNEAEFITKFFHKGSMIVVSGKLQSRKWQDREGNNRTNWEVVADNVYFGEGRRDTNSGDFGRYGDSDYSNSRPTYSRNSQSNNGYGNSAPSFGGFSELDDGDGELPF